MPEEPDLEQVIFEFYQVGNSVKVSAVDPASLVEVSIVGPATAPRAQLERTALSKLKYVLAKRATKRADKRGRG